LKFRQIVGLLLAALLIPIGLIANILAFVLLVMANALGKLVRTEPQKFNSLENPGASIVIPSWNGKELLAACLPALEQAVSVCPGEHEIIVVDNGSTDGSAQYIAENFPTVRIFETPDNLGFGRAANLGIENSTKDIVVLLNNDMVVDENFLVPLLEQFKDKSELFAVTSQIFFWDKDRRREETGKTRVYLRNGSIYPWHDHCIEQNKTTPATYAGGGSSAYDRRKLQLLGGFDELYSPFYVEDLDLSFAAWKRGWQVLFEPRSIVYHKHRGTIGTRFNADFVDSVRRRNEILFAWKNLDSIDLLAKHFGWLWIRVLVRSASGSLGVTKAYIKAMGCLMPAVHKRYLEASRAVISDKAVFQRSTSSTAYDQAFGPEKVLKPGKPLKILFVCPYIPYPASHGGAVRMYNLLKQLARQHEIFLLSFVENEQELAGIGHLEEFCREVKLILREESWRRDNVLWLKPQSSLNEFYAKDFKQSLYQMVDEYDIDIVQYEYTQMAQYMRHFPRAKNVLTEHDLTFVTRYRYWRIIPWSKEKLRGFIRWAVMYVYELDICRNFDLICTVSTNDKELLLGYDSRLRVTDAAPTGADTGYYSPGDRLQVERNTLLFVGFFKHLPNVEGILFFLREIYPLIKQKIPDVRLYIVGANPPPGVTEYETDSSITITGFVDDLREYYAKATAFMVPILRGAGTRVKIFEAMAAGIPIVSTTLGAEGIAVADGDDILLADAPEAFAERVIALLSNPDLQKDLAVNARNLVVEKYDWASIARDLAREYYALWQQSPGAEGHTTLPNEAEPGRIGRVFWKIAKYILFPLGFILLIMRVMFRLAGYWFWKVLKSAR
jgi:O-antigen biosynthesis protein